MSYCSNTENIQIQAWVCGTPQPKGCISHSGHLYVNLVEGNTIDPALGSGQVPPTYAGAFDLCGLIDYLAGENTTITDNVDGTFTATTPDGVTATWSTNTETIATDNGDGTGYITNPDGSVVAIATFPVTYTYPTTVGADGVMVINGSDGSSQTVQFPVDLDYDNHTIVDGIVTLFDSAGNQIGTPINLNAFISSPHPTISASGGAVVTQDVDGNWTIGFTDTFATVSGATVTDAAGNSVTVPAGSTYNPATNEITTSDGQVVALMVDTDTDTFATQNASGDLVLADGTVVPLTVDTDTDRVNQLTVNADGSITSQIVDIDGNPVGSPTVIPAPVDTDQYVTISETVNANSTTTYAFQNVDINGNNVGTPTSITTADNPVVRHALVDRTIEIETADGTIKNYYSERTYSKVSLPIDTVGPFDATTPIGVVADSDFYITIDVGSYPRQVIAELTHNYADIKGTTNGYLQVVPQWTYDGGATWFDIATGGADSVYENTGEQEFQDVGRTGWKAVTGVTTFGWRIRIADNTLGADAEVRQLTSTAYFYYNRMTEA